MGLSDEEVGLTPDPEKKQGLSDADVGLSFDNVNIRPSRLAPGGQPTGQVDTDLYDAVSKGVVRSYYGNDFAESSNRMLELSRRIAELESKLNSTLSSQYRTQRSPGQQPVGNPMMPEDTVSKRTDAIARDLSIARDLLDKERRENVRLGGIMRATEGNTAGYNELMRVMQQNDPSTSTWSKIKDITSATFQGGDGFWDSAGNALSIGAQAAASSAYPMAEQMAISAVPGGRVASAIAGGTDAAQEEKAQVVNKLLQDAGVDIYDPYARQAFFEKNPEILTALNDAASRQGMKAGAGAGAGMFLGSFLEGKGGVSKPFYRGIGAVSAGKAAAKAAGKAVVSGAEEFAQEFAQEGLEGYLQEAATSGSFKVDPANIYGQGLIGGMAGGVSGVGMYLPGSVGRGVNSLFDSSVRLTPAQMALADILWQAQQAAASQRGQGAQQTPPAGSQPAPAATAAPTPAPVATPAPAAPVAPSATQPAVAPEVNPAAIAGEVPPMPAPPGRAPRAQAPGAQPEAAPTVQPTAQPVVQPAAQQPTPVAPTPAPAPARPLLRKPPYVKQTDWDGMSYETQQLMVREAEERQRKAIEEQRAEAQQRADEARKNPVNQPRKPLSDAYEARLKDRIDRINNAKTEDEVFEILKEEYADKESTHASSREATQAADNVVKPMRQRAAAEAAAAAAAAAAEAEASSASNQGDNDFTGKDDKYLGELRAVAEKAVAGLGKTAEGETKPERIKYLAGQADRLRGMIKDIDAELARRKQTQEKPAVSSQTEEETTAGKNVEENAPAVESVDDYKKQLAKLEKERDAEFKKYQKEKNKKEKNNLSKKISDIDSQIRELQSSIEDIEDREANLNKPEDDVNVVTESPYGRREINDPVANERKRIAIEYAMRNADELGIEEDERRDNMELVDDPERYHAAVEQKNKAGLRIGDIVIVDGKKAIVLSVRRDIEDSNVLLEPGVWTDPDEIQKTGKNIFDGDTGQLKEKGIAEMKERLAKIVSKGRGKSFDAYALRYIIAKREGKPVPKRNMTTLVRSYYSQFNQIPESEYGFESDVLSKYNKELYGDDNSPGILGRLEDASNEEEAMSALGDLRKLIESAASDLLEADNKDGSVRKDIEKTRRDIHIFSILVEAYGSAYAYAKSGDVLQKIKDQDDGWDNPDSEFSFEFDKASPFVKSIRKSKSTSGYRERNYAVDLIPGYSGDDGETTFNPSMDGSGVNDVILPIAIEIIHARMVLDNAESSVDEYSKKKKTKRNKEIVDDEKKTIKEQKDILEKLYALQSLHDKRENYDEAGEEPNPEEDPADVAERERAFAEDDAARPETTDAEHEANMLRNQINETKKEIQAQKERVMDAQEKEAEQDDSPKAAARVAREEKKLTKLQAELKKLEAKLEESQKPESGAKPVVESGKPTKRPAKGTPLSPRYYDQFFRMPNREYGFITSGISSRNDELIGDGKSPGIIGRLENATNREEAIAALKDLRDFIESSSEYLSDLYEKEKTSEEMVKKIRNDIGYIRTLIFAYGSGYAYATSGNILENTDDDQTKESKFDFEYSKASPFAKSVKKSKSSGYEESNHSVELVPGYATKNGMTVFSPPHRMGSINTKVAPVLLQILDAKIKISEIESAIEELSGKKRKTIDVVSKIKSLNKDLNEKKEDLARLEKLSPPPKGTVAIKSQESMPEKLTPAQEAEIARKAAELDRRRAARRLAQATNENPVTRRRGPEQVVQRIVNELRRGGTMNIAQINTAMRLIESLIDNGYLDNLAVSPSESVNYETDVKGSYHPATQLIRLFVMNIADDGTGREIGEHFIHEVAHHLERMLPESDIRALRQDLVRARAAWLKGKKGLKELLGDGNWLNQSWTEKQIEAHVDKMIAEGKMTEADRAPFWEMLRGIMKRDQTTRRYKLAATKEAYKLMNTSEWWAVNVGRIASERDQARPNPQGEIAVWARLRAFMKRAYSAVLQIMGRDNAERIWTNFQEGKYEAEFQRQSMADQNEENLSREEDPENMRIPGGMREKFLESKKGQEPVVKPILFVTDIGHNEDDPENNYLWAIDATGNFMMISLKHLMDAMSDMEMDPEDGIVTHTDWSMLIDKNVLPGNSDGRKNTLLRGTAHGRAEVGDVIRMSIVGHGEKDSEHEYTRDTVKDDIGRELRSWAKSPEVKQKTRDIKGYDFTGLHPWSPTPEVFSQEGEAGFTRDNEITGDSPDRLNGVNGPFTVNAFHASDNQGEFGEKEKTYFSLGKAGLDQFSKDVKEYKVSVKRPANLLAGLKSNKKLMGLLLKFWNESKSNENVIGPNFKEQFGEDPTFGDFIQAVEDGDLWNMFDTVQGDLEQFLFDNGYDGIVMMDNSSSSDPVVVVNNRSAINASTSKTGANHGDAELASRGFLTKVAAEGAAKLAGMKVTVREDKNHGFDGGTRVMELSIVNANGKLVAQIDYRIRPGGESAYVLASDVTRSMRNKGYGKILYAEMGERLRRAGTMSVDGTVTDKKGRPIKIRLSVFGKRSTEIIDEMIEDGRWQREVETQIDPNRLLSSQEEAGFTRDNEPNHGDAELASRGFITNWSSENLPADYRNGAVLKGGFNKFGDIAMTLDDPDKNSVAAIKVTVEGDSATVDRIDVDPSARGNRISNALYAEVGERLRRAGVKTLDGKVIDQEKRPIKARESVFGKGNTEITGEDKFTAEQTGGDPEVHRWVQSAIDPDRRLSAEEKAGFERDREIGMELIKQGKKFGGGSMENFIKAMDNWARGVLKPGNMNSISPAILAAMTWQTARAIKNGMTEFTKWAKSMIKNFGPNIKGSLPALWRGAKYIANNYNRFPGYRYLMGVSSRIWDIVDRNPQSPSLRRMANFLMSRTGPDAEATQEDIPSRIKRTGKQFSNLYSRMMERFSLKFSQMSKDERRAWDIEFRKHIIEGTTPSDPDMAIGVEEYRALMRALLEFQRAAGLDVGDIGPNYMPRAYSRDDIEADYDGFIAAAKAAYRMRNDRLWAAAEERLDREMSVKVDELRQADIDKGRAVKTDAEYKAIADKWYDAQQQKIEEEYNKSDTDFQVMAEQWGRNITQGEISDLMLGEPERIEGKTDSIDSRVFNDAEGSLLDKYMIKDVDELTVRYIRNAVRKSEVARVFGKDGKGYTKLMDQAVNEGVPFDYIKEMHYLTNKALGLGLNRFGSGTAKVMDWLNVVIASSYLGMSFMYNMFLEPVSFGIRTNILTATKGLALTWMKFGRVVADMTPEQRQLMESEFGSSAAFHEELTKTLGESLGLIENELERHYSDSHWDYSENEGGSKWAKALSQRIYRSNLMMATEQAKVEASISVAMRSIRDNCLYLAGEHPLQKLFSKIGMDATAPRSTATFFNQIGIPEAEHAAFAKFVASMDGMNNSQLEQAIMEPGNPMAALYRQAVSRMSLSMSVKASNNTRIADADSVAGRLIMQLMNYTYAFFAHNVEYIYRSTKAALTEGNMTKIDRMRYLAPVLGGVMTVVAAFGQQELRHLVDPSEGTRSRQSETMTEKVADAFVIAGAFPPPVQIIAKASIQKKVPGGPIIDVPFQIGYRAIKAVTSKGDAAKRALAEQVVETGVKPVFIGGAASINPALGFVANTIAQREEFTETLADLLTGPEKKPKKKP